MNTLFSNLYFRSGLLVLGGIFIGWLLFHSSPKPENKQTITAEEKKATVWTCSMHPQIHLDKPGKCPICAMDLIPLNPHTGAATDSDAVHLSKEAAVLAGISTSAASKQQEAREIRLYGKVQADERLSQSQVAYIPGRIEKLTVAFTGQPVSKGQTLALIYSPELITAQQELLEAAKTKQSQPDIYEAAKEKLHQWKLTPRQIAGIENSRQIKNDVELTANTSGIVTAKRVNAGDYVSQGTVLFDVVDLSRVWVMFDAYESDLPFLARGTKISFTMQALPGISLSGTVAFIDPVVDPVTRVAKVRVEMGNQGGRLKPGMFATGIVEANLAEYQHKLSIPRSAVLWTGKRSVVYVKQNSTNELVFKMREVELGPLLGNRYVIVSGLTEGEEVVTQGAFSIDAAAQLEGKPSMMGQPAGQSTASGTAQTKQMPAETDLSNIMQVYLDMKDALVQSNSKLAAQKAKALQNAFAKSGLPAPVLKTLRTPLQDIAASSGLDKQRAAFAVFNTAFYPVARQAKLGTKTIYYQHCPMFNHNKGAYWLSADKEIRNPYYGDEMPDCGENKGIVK
jgi:membrane fusion protein, copper/silver efflux system